MASTLVVVVVTWVLVAAETELAERSWTGVGIDLFRFFQRLPCRIRNQW